MLEQVVRLDGAPSERYYARLRRAAAFTREARLELAERRLALLREEIPDRPVRSFDLFVDVVERPPEPPRDLRPDGRLAGAHEADEHYVPVQINHGPTSHAPVPDTSREAVTQL